MEASRNVGSGPAPPEAHICVRLILAAKPLFALAHRSRHGFAEDGY
jgi:hypothetical protein